MIVIIKNLNDFNLNLHGNKEPLVLFISNGFALLKKLLKHNYDLILNVIIKNKIFRVFIDNHAVFCVATIDNFTSF